NNPYIGNSIITGEFLPAPAGRNVQGWGSFVAAATIYFPDVGKVNKDAPEGKSLRRRVPCAAVPPSPVVPLFPKCPAGISALWVFPTSGKQLTPSRFMRRCLIKINAAALADRTKSEKKQGSAMYRTLLFFGGAC
ncbi:MAG: hypothetical protein LUG15_02270, partial [Oscillospiraceae bacterium]|nr:hypothetical protein [Oscillospiraceae bacterium]